MNAVAGALLAAADAPAPALPVEMGDAAAKVVGRLGRTEDLRFSPDGRRLAVAVFGKSEIVLFGVAVTGGAVRLSGPVEIASPDLAAPHGLDFIGPERLVVANRDGGVAIFRVPEDAAGRVDIRAERVLDRAGWFHRIRAPGSVVAVPCDGGAELLVCNNFRNRITAHRFDPGRPGGRVASRIALAEGMHTPDGVAVGPAGKVIAVSSHSSHEVLIYDRTRELSRRTLPVARLVGVERPHGLRFAGDGRLLVADAARPRIMVFDRPSGGWAGTISPAGEIVPMSEDLFHAGRTSPLEGGPKGIEIHPGGDVLAVTCERLPVAFFSLAALGWGARA